MDESYREKDKQNKKAKLIAFIIQFSKVTVAGVSCFALDFGLMVFLTEVPNVHYLLAAGISFTVATAVNYIISLKWVYTVEERGADILRFAVFLTLSLIGLGLNTVLLWAFTEGLSLHYMISKIIVSAVVSIYNYITRKLYLEKRR